MAGYASLFYWYALSTGRRRLVFTLQLLLPGPTYAPLYLVLFLPRKKTPPEEGGTSLSKTLFECCPQCHDVSRLC